MRLALAFVVGALLTAACAPAAPTAAPAPSTAQSDRAERQILRIGTSTAPSNLTPQGGTFFPEYFAPLYDTLTQFGPGFVPQPAVATRWEVSADGLTWTFTLRDDVTWPDGSRLTADDVAFTMDTIFQLNWPQRSLFGLVRQTRAVTPTTVEFTLTAPDMALPNNAGSLRIVPRAYFQRVGFDGFLQQPVGSGPYELVEYRSSDIIRFRKRPAKHAFRNPAIEELTFRYIPEAAQQIAGLRTGELDMIVGNYPVDSLEQLRRQGFEINNQERTSSHINFPFSSYEARNTPLRDRRVREAMNYAINKDAIAQGIFRGFNRPVGQMGTPGSPWWDDSVQPVPFNPQRARQLLAEAGYPNGFRVTFDVQPGQIPQEMILAVQSNLRDVGIDMELIQNDQAAFLDKYFGRAAKADLFPLISGETNGFFQTFRTAYTCAPPGGQGLGIYCNPQVDTLINQAFAERDPARRAQIYKEANRLMRADWPQIWLVTVSFAFIHGPKVRGLEFPTPTQYNFDSVFIAR